MRVASRGDDRILLGGNDKLYAMSGVEFELRQFARRQYQFDPFFSGDAEMADWAGVSPEFGLE